MHQRPCSKINKIKPGSDQLIYPRKACNAPLLEICRVDFSYLSESLSLAAAADISLDNTLAFVSASSLSYLRYFRIGDLFYESGPVTRNPQLVTIKKAKSLDLKAFIGSV